MCFSRIHSNATG
jgi:hypothetical protein